MEHWSWKKLFEWLFGFLVKLAGIVILSFALFHLSGIDPARSKLGPMASQQSVERTRIELGLDQPLWKQFRQYADAAAHGDCGTSFRNGTAVAPLVWTKFIRTLRMTAGGLIPALFGSYFLALALHLWPNIARPLLLGIRGIAVLPAFLIAVGGLLSLSLLGVSMSGKVASFAPCMLIGLFPLASLTLLLHSATSVRPPPSAWRTARAFGQSRWEAFHRALFAPTVAPWLTAWTIQLSQAIFAAMVIEIVLTVDGCGNLLANAVQQRDLPVIRGVLFANGVFFLVLLACLEGICIWLDPRRASSDILAQ